MGSTPAIRTKQQGLLDTKTNKAYQQVAKGKFMQTSSVKSVFLVLIMFTATLSGCFGEQAKETEQQIADFQINFTSADLSLIHI